MVRKGRSERTIESYRDHVERIFKEWPDSPLQELGLDPAKVVNKHDDITKKNGPYIANGSMRTLRATESRVFPPVKWTVMTEIDPTLRKRSVVQTDQSPCPKCQAAMGLVPAVPGLGHLAHRIFECGKCRHIQVAPN
jgi:hypothetical protein